MNGEHRIILDAIKDVKKDIREVRIDVRKEVRVINTELRKGALTFATKGLLYKAFGVLFLLLSALTTYVMYGGRGK